MKSTKHQRLTSRILIVLCLVTGIFATPVLAEYQRTKIAVLDFGIIGDKLEPESIGSILSEWFTTSIVKSGRFDVVERAMLQKILAEQKLATSGVIDESTASELGKILGVKVIITGSILKLRNTIDINARIINVQSGSIISAESIRSDKGEDYHDMVEKLTAKIMQNFPLTGYVVKKNEKTAIIDLGLLSGLVPGTEFIVYKEGAVIKHPKTGEVLDVEQIKTGRLRITKVERNVASGEILSEEVDGIEYGHLVKSVPKSLQSETAQTVPKQKPQVYAEQPDPKPAVPVAPQSPPPQVVALKKAQTKRILTPVPEPAPADERLSSPNTTPQAVEKPASLQPALKTGPKNHVAVFPPLLLMQADHIQRYIEGGIPDVATKVLDDIDRSRRFKFTNLVKDKSLQSKSWDRFRPNVNGIIEQARQQEIDYVLLYSFSFWAGQGLVNGWGTDFNNPTFRVFLVDVNNGKIFEKENTSTIAQDQLFLDLRGMTRSLMEKTNFPN